MSELSNQISREEYLQRYISGDHLKKKVKKKKSKIAVKKPAGLKIIDNDIDMNSIDVKDDIEDECGEEAPVVAEVIDERPKEVQLREQYNSANWKRIGSGDEDSAVGDQLNGSERISNPVSEGGFSRSERHDSDSDSSLPRKSAPDCSTPVDKVDMVDQKVLDSDGDLSPPRVRHSTDKAQHNSDSDLSPRRKTSNISKSEKARSKKYSNSNRDLLSPDSYKNKGIVSKCKRQDSDSDLSPPRSYENKEVTSIKKERSDSDLSPPRNRKERTSRPHVVSKAQDSDNDLSPERLGHRVKNHSSRDGSPVRHKNNKERKSKHSHMITDNDLSPPRKMNKFVDSSNSRPESSKRPSNKDSESDRDNDVKSLSQGNKKNRPTATLSGLKAGLQSASTLREETKLLKNRETKHIMELPDELSGRNAETVYRDRSTGQKRDLKEEMKKKEEEAKKLSEKEKKYSEWGKGLKQKEDQMKQFENDAYEMSKPLARYRDDEDLDRALRDQMREEDPMFEYMQKKKQKQQNTPVCPKYSGPPAPPNRFNIQPGYRWDGVDRSNGFEKRYFEKISKDKSKDVESYLWSVQDM